MQASISNTVLQMVLAQANKDQNQHYPPSIYSSHYQLATNYLINECVKRYPGTKAINDLIGPYIANKLVIVKAGNISFPIEYRNLIGFGTYVTDLKNPQNICSQDELPDNPTDDQLAEIIAAKKNVSKHVDEVSIGRWDDLTDSAYKAPTLKDPIACIFDTNGFRICPSDVPIVEVRYIVKTPDYVYGYIMNPDETFFFDPTSTIEALWKENAIEYLFKAINILYANYVRDPEGSASARDLRDAGLL